MAKKKSNITLIVAGAVFVVGLVLLLIVLLSPVSKIGKYKITEEVAGQEITYTYKFSKDKLETTRTVEGEDPMVLEYEYKVEDGKLLLKTVPGVYTERAEINSRKITMGSEDTVVKNGLATATLIVSIVLTAVGALGAGAALVLNKKK
jgi:hypothetical protein